MRKLFSVVAICLATSALSPAITLIFCGQDYVTGPSDPKPNSNAAAVDFVTLAGSIQPISVATFEAPSVGALGGALGPGLTGTSTNQTAGLAGIQTNNDPTWGWNTTSFGSKGYRFYNDNDTQAATLTLTFAMPVNSFGAFFSGYQTAPGAFTIERMTPQGIQALDLVPSPQGINNVQFCGFVDTVNTFTSVTLRMTPAVGSSGQVDAITVDDAMYGNCIVPEPATLAALAAGALAFVRRRKR